MYLLLVLGIGLIGAGTAALRFAARSIAAIGSGAGAMVAAGLLSVFFALVESRLAIHEASIPKDATSVASQSRDPNPENQRPAWPPKTSRHSRFE